MTDECPVCGGPLAERTPLVPRVAAYDCERCSYRWRGRGDSL